MCPKFHIRTIFMPAMLNCLRSFLAELWLTTCYMDNCHNGIMVFSLRRGFTHFCIQSLDIHQCSAITKFKTQSTSYLPLLILNDGYLLHEPCVPFMSCALSSWTISAADHHLWLHTTHFYFCAAVSALMTISCIQPLLQGK